MITTITFLLSPVFPVLYYFLISRKKNIDPKRLEQKQEKQREREQVAAEWREADRKRREEKEQVAVAKKESEYQRQQGEEKSQIEKLKKLIQVSETLQITQVGEYLDLNGQELFNKLVDWAAEFGFTIDQQVVKYGSGRKDDFIAELDKEFKKWNKQTTGKV